MNPPLLSVRDLAIDFPARRGTVSVLDGVSFDIGHGEIVGIVGGSGAGKSLIANAVMGILDAAARLQRGEILFEGRDVLAMPPAERGRWRGKSASIIFQNPRTALNPIRTVGDQIADVIARHAPAAADVVRAQTLSALRQVRIAGAEWRRDAYPSALSGGLCQRVGIAMALAASPRLLIADEPTTDLDVTTQAAIMDLIRTLARQRGMAVALITHDLALASEYCDRLVVLHAGKVVEAGPTTELLAHPRHAHCARLLRSVPAHADRIEDLPPDGDMQPEPQRNEAIGGRIAPGPAAALPLVEAVGVSIHFPVAARGLFSRPSMLHAVDGVDLAIKAGEAVGLVGESGCGKSTLARLICRLIDPTAGTLRLDGRDITDRTIRQFSRSPDRRQVQMVFQDPTESLNPRFPVFDLIADPVRMLLPGEAGKAVRERVEAAARAVDLPLSLLERLPHQLSTGQKARAGIARAIAVEPRLLVLDEPTSALDLSVQATVLKLLDRLRRERDMAMLFVSHDLDVVRLMCSRIAVMYLGQVVESGPTELVYRAPRHPYTKALLAAVPRLDGRSAPRIRLEGDPQSPTNPSPNRCRFSGRCNREQPECTLRGPALRPLSDGRMLRCHLAP